MNSTAAKLEYTEDLVVYEQETLPVDAPAIQPEAPVIQPEMAQLLEFTQKNESSVTPREINDHLARILQSYDDLTAQYAENNLRIDAELASIKTAGGTVSSQLHQIDAELRLQNGAVTALNASVTADVQRLGAGIASLRVLLATQENIIGEQSARLDQFDMAYELLDTATRGNRNRIETVREEAEKQQAVLTAQILGLTALQREHYAEFKNLQNFVGILQTETVRLDGAIQQVSTDLAGHVDVTQTRFKRTAAYLIGLSLLTAGGFALVKWAPVFAPASTEAAIVQSNQRINDVNAQLAGLPVLQATAAEHEGKLDAIASQVSRLEQGMGSLSKSVVSLRVAKDVGAATGLQMLDSNWVQQQNPKAYTVQILGAPAYDDLTNFVVQHAAQLQDASVAYTLTQRDQRDRYNLFYGVFDSAEAARAAIDALPADLRAQKPWVRQLRSVQGALN